MSKGRLWIVMENYGQNDLEFIGFNQDIENNTKGNQKKQPKGHRESTEEEKQKRENDKMRDEKIEDFGQVTLKNNANNKKIHLISIIGEVEGHQCLPQQNKTTKYEHILPQLAAIEDSCEIDGVLILLNTVGGDVEAGLAIAEMISSVSKPTVSLVLGGSHSIGIPIAVSTEYSFIVPTGTMVIHPVRMSGTVIGAPQTYDYFKQMQDRIIGFISSHCNANEERLEEMMMNTGMLTKDLGTILVGEEAVNEGIIDEVGGIKEALKKLYSMIDERCDHKKENQSKDGLNQQNQNQQNQNQENQNQ